MNKIRHSWLVLSIVGRIVSVYRTAHFNAAHRLNVPQWTKEENKAFFGLCNNDNYHGHNYDLQVKVTGEVDEVSGYLIDMKVLKQYIKEEVTQRFDHKNLNLQVEDFKDLNPTAENISVVIYNKIKPRLAKNLKLEITLYETPRNFVTYSGN